MVWRKVKAWTFGIYWLRLNLAVLCPSFMILGQLPPSKPQSPHFENCVENIMYLLRNLMYFIPDEKIR